MLYHYHADFISSVFPSNTRTPSIYTTAPSLSGTMALSECSEKQTTHRVLWVSSLSMNKRPPRSKQGDTRLKRKPSAYNSASQNLVSLTNTDRARSALTSPTSASRPDDHTPVAACSSSLSSSHLCSASAATSSSWQAYLGAQCHS